MIFESGKLKNLTNTKKVANARSTLPCKENVEKRYTKVAFLLLKQPYFGESFKPQMSTSKPDVTPPVGQDVAENIIQTSCHSQPS